MWYRENCEKSHKKRRKLTQICMKNKVRTCVNTFSIKKKIRDCRNTSWYFTWPLDLTTNSHKKSKVNIWNVKIKLLALNPYNILIIILYISNRNLILKTKDTKYNWSTTKIGPQINKIQIFHNPKIYKD